MSWPASRKFDVLILGAGGAGMMCALTAGVRGKKVALLDHSPKLGQKILISGGGRCNFTNIHAKPENYLSENPHFAKSALSRFQPDDFLKLIKKHQIQFHEKKLGQLFCDKRADQIVELLKTEVKNTGGEIFLSCKIESVKKENEFIVRTNLGEFTAPSLVIATGGLSIPKIGATGIGYEIAKNFGHKIIETHPALDGFTLKADDLRHFKELAGVSLDCEVSSGGKKFRENLLFTHRGLSGPAMLQASLYWKKKAAIEINLIPSFDFLDWAKTKKKEGAKSLLKNLLKEIFSERFCEVFCELYLKNNQPFAEISDQKLLEFSNKLKKWVLYPESTVGYEKAEVTRGGVDTHELSSQTMESNKVSGLFFIGEVVDVTGQLGGFNFQWAWASGSAAGEFV
ncbi:MAG: NAD(P)/FAD-dependent oxidoreductase [Dechloromonas sp.]|nr:NAD(P)/FAD-dependent oxidoreductase [Dechloromonas sp.]MBN8555356.1 NAD(P)/FAD-dependent oxidoreductase [Deltaproteobacteria bacterium]